MPIHARPTSLDDALAHLAATPLSVVAGGTDHYPARVGRPLDDDVLDITALADLRGIAEHGDHWRIGASTTWSMLRDAALPPWFDALRLAAGVVGGRQIQNTATLGGNLCNASPAADGVPPLLAMDAAVELASVGGVERRPLADFLCGNRVTARRPDQLLTAVVVSKPRTQRAISHFLKLGARHDLVISIAMVGVGLEIDPRGQIARARIAVGACAPVAQRLPAAEAALTGQTLDPDLGQRVQPAHLAPLDPIEDLRASAAYRLDAALTLIRRALARLAAEP